MRSPQRLPAAIVALSALSLVLGCSSDPVSSSGLAAPANVTATSGDGAVTIAWDAALGAESYDLYWSTLPGVGGTNLSTRVGPVTSPYTLHDLTPMTPHYFVVTANYPSANTLRYSAEVSATPAGAVATASNGQVTLEWSPTTNATSYNIYWSTTPGVTPATGTKIAGVTSPYVHTGLANCTEHYYVVTPVTGGIEGAPSLVKAAEPSEYAPDAPTSVSAAPGDGQVTVAWEAKVSSHVNDVLSWSTTSDFAVSTDVSPAASPYVHAGATNGTTYYYKITRVIDSGWGPYEYPSCVRSATPGP